MTRSEAVIELTKTRNFILARKPPIGDAGERLVMALAIAIEALGESEVA